MFRLPTITALVMMVLLWLHPPLCGAKNIPRSLSLKKKSSVIEDVQDGNPNRRRTIREQPIVVKHSEDIEEENETKPTVENSKMGEENSVLSNIEKEFFAKEPSAAEQTQIPTDSRSSGPINNVIPTSRSRNIESVEFQEDNHDSETGPNEASWVEGNMYMYGPDNKREKRATVSDLTEAQRTEITKEVNAVMRSGLSTLKQKAFIQFLTRKYNLTQSEDTDELPPPTTYNPEVDRVIEEATLPTYNHATEEELGAEESRASVITPRVIEIDEVDNFKINEEDNMPEDERVVIGK